MKKVCFLFLILFYSFSFLAGNEYPDFTRHIRKTNKALRETGEQFDKFKQIDLQLTRNMGCYDVEYYFIDVAIDFAEEYITAAVEMKFTALENDVTQIDLNFANTLNVDQISLDGEVLEYVHADDIITIDLPEPLDIDDLAEIRIDYSGTPVNRLNDGMKFHTHAGTPVVFTMVSPMGARKWWPCKDTPGDKPDSIAIRLTYPEEYISASNGLMVASENNGDGSKTDLWQEAYPVATYLTSFAITNYEIFSQTYEYGGETMEIMHHVYPEQYDVSVELYTPTPDMIDFYSTIYGPYPFLTEKYGHASTTDLGALAMEHQTCTSFDAGYITDPEATYTVAHELAHQWTGDFLTIGNWEHVWLKEGFARYSEALWAEHLYGYEALLDYMDVLDNGSPLDPALQRDPEGSGNDIFNIVIYSKGAWTQHMLRGTIGDEDYFEAVMDLMTDPDLMYGNFLTEDLENAAENASGMELDWFFDQWFYQEGRPSYNYTLYTADGAQPWIAIESLPFGENYFSMYIPYSYEEQPGRIFAEGGLNHLQLGFAGTSHEVLLDPDNWVLDYGYNLQVPILEDIEVRDSNIGLAWEEFFDPEVDGFNVYRALPDEAFVKLNEVPVTENFYFDEDLEPGILHRYKITVVYQEIYESAASNTIEVEPVNYTFDQGILVVDNSGDFNSPFPTDEEVDSFYAYLLEEMNFTEWDIAASGLPPLEEMALYSTIIWHSDDILFNPLIDNFFSLKNYLTAGGNLFLSNCRSLEELTAYDLEDFLAIEAKELNGDADFLGAYGTNGYPDITIDLNKIPLPTWDDAFANIYKFTPTTAGEAIYGFDSQTDDPDWENEVCAVKKIGDHRIITLGFPLYFMEEDAAYELLQQALNDLGEITAVEEEVIPDNKINLTNYPNPFNPETTISFNLTAKSAKGAKLEIYNIKGQKLKSFHLDADTMPVTLSGLPSRNGVEAGVEGSTEPEAASSPSTRLRMTQAGSSYSITWNGTDDNGHPVPSGIYFARLKAGEETAVRKMILIK